MRPLTGWRICLLTRGGPGRCVALLLPRSAQAITAILAVLKCGAAYVPIDVGLPVARIGFLLADAAPIAAISTTGLRSRLDGYEVAVLDIDDPRVRLNPVPPCGAGPDDLAYLIYTSGHHRCSQRRCRHSPQRHPTAGVVAPCCRGPGQVWSQWHSHSFDGSVKEIFGALLSGGRVVVVPESVARSPEDFQTLLVAEQVTVLAQTPSAVAMSHRRVWNR